MAGLGTTLESLDLSNNFLIGLIPSNLGQLENLNSLQLDSNQITGHILVELGNLALLQYLNLSNDSLFGSIPAEIAKAISILPKELANIPYINLSYNSFDFSEDLDSNSKLPVTL
ncbi:LRR receptor kinase SERL2, partial [Mucuna pruriens]